MNSYRMKTLKESGIQLLDAMDAAMGGVIVSYEDDTEAVNDLQIYRLFRKLYVDVGKLLSEQDEALHRMCAQISVLEEETKKLDEAYRNRKKVLDDLESIKFDPDKRV